MINETLSVIIPVWKPNLEHFEDCINSMINQTYDNLEILVIYRNDEEHDKKFFEFMENYKDDKRVKTILGKKTGFVNSLNEGIQSSTGDLIGRIDGDDYSELSRFEKQIEFKKNNNLDIVGTWAYWVSNDGSLSKVEPPISHNEIRSKIMLHCPMLHPTILMDKKMLQKIGNYDSTFIHAEDYELYFRAMHLGYRFGNVPEHLVYIRDAIDSRSRGEEWKLQRQYYIKAKNKAFSSYGFNTPKDVVYHSITPLSNFMSPRVWLKLRKFTGWSK